MIAYLQGTILKKIPKAVILDTGNVGYLVYLSAPLLEKIKEKDQAEFFIYTKVREDDISLFGFETFNELEFYKILLSVNGIGPKLAMEILSQNTDKVKSAIIGGDLAYLSKIPGIGKKTAERIVVELKNKVELADISRLHAKIEHTVEDEVIDALQNLGYQKFEVMRVLKNAPAELIEAEAIITYFLQNV